jgi:hypothetical protein
MSLLSKKDHEMVIEALETLIQTKEESDDKFQYVNLLNWVKLKSKDKF